MMIRESSFPIKFTHSLTDTLNNVSLVRIDDDLVKSVLVYLNYKSIED